MNKLHVSDVLASEVVNDVIRPLIREVPNFPIDGIVFKDITPILADYAALDLSTLFMARFFQEQMVSKVAGIETRGLYFAPGIARFLHAGLVPLRKPGKLPYETMSEDYTLEYGCNSMHMHVDAIRPGEQVVVVDDVLATGGTIKAACNLVERGGGIVAGISVLIDLGICARNDFPVEPRAVIRY